MMSCDDEHYIDMNFASEMEQPSADRQEKSYLSNEQYIYWDETDVIRLFPSNRPSDYLDCILKPEANPRYAAFTAHGVLESDFYYGVFPNTFASEDSYTELTIPSTQSYRDDFSFGGSSWPMVAYGASDEGVPHLDFHAVCGMARIQLTATEAATISSITFTENGAAHSGYTTQPISGLFSIQNIRENAPHIVPVSATSGTQITLTGINKAVSSSAMCTFYLPLPATTAYNAYPTTTSYAITMQVNSDRGVFTKDFAVKIGRNRITPIRAININAWGGSSSSIGLSGCGTEERPFLIMNLSDLKKVKTAFDMATPTINGQVITADTYFNVSSSDIELTEAEWTEGINNFKGHLIYRSGNTTLQSIKNSSQAPLFKSISADGIVEDITIRGTLTYRGSVDFSPFCGVNNGTIERCKNNCSVLASYASVAGIAVTNNGRIHNAANTQAVTVQSTNKYAGGICLTNNGTIDGYGTSIGKVKGSQAGSICHTNNSVVTNCQIRLNRTDLTAPFGGLVYINKPGGSIKNSEVLGMASSTSDIGGICFQNEGLIDQCKVGTDLLRGRGTVGGIAAYQRNSGTAEVRNCYNITANTANLEAVTGKVGGIVGYVGTGKVLNCYCDMEVASAEVENFGAIIGEITGTGVVENCYNGSRQARFCGLSNRMANLQRNCFDITDDLDNACIYNTSSGQITRLTAGSYGSIGDYMVESLNAWVTANQGTNADGSPKYLIWTADSPASNVSPEFVSSTH